MFVQYYRFYHEFGFVTHTYLLNLLTYSIPLPVYNFVCFTNIFSFMHFTTLTHTGLDLGLGLIGFGLVCFGLGLGFVLGLTLLGLGLISVSR